MHMEQQENWKNPINFENEEKKGRLTLPDSRFNKKFQ